MSGLVARWALGACPTVPRLWISVAKSLDQVVRDANGQEADHRALGRHSQLHHVDRGVKELAPSVHVGSVSTRTDAASQTKHHERRLFVLSL